MKKLASPRSVYRHVASLGAKYSDILAIFLAVLFGIMGSIVSVVRYWQYETYYIDFGIFDQAIWKVAHFQPPVIEHFIVGGKWIFADHFNPSIFLLSPLYWFTNHSEVILIAQALAVAASGFILYQIGKSVTKSHLWSITILLCYFLFIGLQNAVITEFHELTVMTLPLTLTWWAAIKKKKMFYFVMLLITLGFKEALFTLGISLGIALFFLQKDWRKIAIVTMIISFIWGWVSIKYIIPYFSGGIYIYSPNMPANPLGYLTGFFDQVDKRKTLFSSFASFGFLPFFAPAFWPAIIQDYALRFLPIGFNTRWTLGLHYNAQSAVILALSSFYSIRLFLTKKFFKVFGFILTGVLVLFALFLNLYVLHEPFALVYNPAFYTHTKDLQFLNDLVRRVPPHVSVMAQNNLAGRFTHQQVYLLKLNYEQYVPEYILFDVRDGQEPSDFFGGGDPKVILAAVKVDPKYKAIYQTKEQFVFKRK